ncbi:putative endopeptidase [Oxalobacteraceae bacterium GrIS 2.11]
MQGNLISITTLVALCFTMPTAANAQSEPATPNSGIELQWLDHGVRPQDDFVQFMSGKWLDAKEIPADRARYTSFDVLVDLNESRLHDLVTTLTETKDIPDGSNGQKIVDLYNSYMNEPLADQLAIKPIQNLFVKVERLKSKSQLPALSAAFGKWNIASPINISIGQDARDSKVYAVYLNQGGLSLPDRDYYLNQDDAKMKGFREAYLKHVQAMIELAGSKNGAQFAAQILNLETALAKIQWTRVQNRDPVKTYNKVDVQELGEKLPNFNWTAYLTETGVAKKVNYVIVRQPSFIKDMNKIIQDTPFEVWKTYYKWRALNAFAPYLSKKFVDEDFAFNSKILRGIPENKPRWKRGIAEVEAAVPEALGQLYVAKYFPPQYKARMEKLVGNLTLAYQQSIESLSWMSTDTKHEALIKLSKFTPKIAYPEKWRDYGKLVIRKNDLVGNVMRAREFEDQRQVNKLGRPVDKTEWGMSPQTVNAYYNSRNNEIVFPAAILQPPFFNAEADDAVNYGGIGAVIGHEISHGFDDAGSQSDGDGNLRDWWTKDDKANFKALTSALVQQYSAFSPIEGYHVNGELTLGENIADNSGLAIAYKAYQLSLGGHEAPVIDGYTGNQRLYMGWAQVWRGKARDAETIRLINVDPHSPSKARGNLPLVNQPGFYSAFEVKENDQMYVAPDKRIIIW